MQSLSSATAREADVQILTTTHQKRDLGSVRKKHAGGGPIPLLVAVHIHPFRWLGRRHHLAVAKNVTVQFRASDFLLLIERHNRGNKYVDHKK